VAWTYSGDPSSSAKDAVRFAIGDTDATDPLLTDEEINHLVAEYGTAKQAAPAAAEAIAAKFSRQASKSVGDLSIQLNQKAEAYMALARRLAQRASTVAAAPYAGGVDAADRASETDTSLLQPVFKRGMHEPAGEV
jgi:hypothetical protein